MLPEAWKHVRFKDATDILKTSTTTSTPAATVTDVVDPTADKHAANKEYVDKLVAGIDLGDGYIPTSGTTTVSDGWKIQSAEKSHFHYENGQTKIYWLQNPVSAQHPVTLSYAEGKYFNKNGGTLGGKLSFANNGFIDANTGNTVLHGRGCFELRSSADKPLIFSSGSGSKRLVSFYGYDGSADDNKSEKAYITAGGDARFKGVYANGKELATKEYVDANAGGGGGGAIANSGTNENPSLKTGELYLCTKNNTLYIGS